MSEYSEVEQPFLQQLAALGWTVVDQGQRYPSAPEKSLRASFREWILPDVFRGAVKAINRTQGGEPWLTTRQLDELRDQLLEVDPIVRTISKAC